MKPVKGRKCKKENVLHPYYDGEFSRNENAAFPKRRNAYSCHETRAGEACTDAHASSPRVLSASLSDAISSSRRAVRSAKSTPASRQDGLSLSKYLSAALSSFCVLLRSRIVCARSASAETFCFRFVSSSSVLASLSAVEVEENSSKAAAAAASSELVSWSRRTKSERITSSMPMTPLPPPMPL